MIYLKVNMQRLVRIVLRSNTFAQSQNVLCTTFPSLTKSSHLTLDSPLISLELSIYKPGQRLTALPYLAMGPGGLISGYGTSDERCSLIIISKKRLKNTHFTFSINKEPSGKRGEKRREDPITPAWEHES